MTRHKGKRRDRTPQPSTMDLNDPDGVAYHEAAHAVLDVALGLPLDVVAVGPATAGADGVPLANAPAGSSFMGYTKHEPIVLDSLDAAGRFAYTVGAMAGVMAERYRREERYPTEPPDRRRRWETNMHRAVWDADVADARQYAGSVAAALYGDDADQRPDWPDRSRVLWGAVVHCAAELIYATWPAIGAVAAALLEHGTLTGADVSTIVAAAVDGGHVDAGAIGRGRADAALARLTGDAEP